MEPQREFCSIYLEFQVIKAPYQMPNPPYQQGDIYYPVPAGTGHPYGATHPQSMAPPAYPGQIYPYPPQAGISERVQSIASLGCMRNATLSLRCSYPNSESDEWLIY